MGSNPTGPTFRYASLTGDPREVFGLLSNLARATESYPFLGASCSGCLTHHSRVLLAMRFQHLPHIGLRLRPYSISSRISVLRHSGFQGFLQRSATSSMSSSKTNPDANLAYLDSPACGLRKPSIDQRKRRICRNRSREQQGRDRVDQSYRVQPRIDKFCEEQTLNDLADKLRHCENSHPNKHESQL